MKETQILFTAPMVLALLADTKTQTRRPVKWRELAPGLNLAFTGLSAFAYPQGWVLEGPSRTSSEWLSQPTPCPYGAPGDHLTVRETFYAFGRWETRYSAKKRRDEWHFVDMTQECCHAYLYAADHPRPQPLAGKRDGGVTPKWWKRPAIFMPRAATRITLKVVSVRVERLQAISEADAIAEGIEQMPCAAPNTRLWRNYDPSNGWTPSVAIPQNSYRSLWEVINGADAWAPNPWVWAVEFRRLP